MDVLQAIRDFRRDRSAANKQQLVAALKHVDDPQYAAVIGRILVKLETSPQPVVVAAAAEEERAAVLFAPETILPEFGEIIGYDHLKMLLNSKVVQPIKYPEFQTGKKGGNGFLFYGPGGTGKTTFARYVGTLTSKPVYMVDAAQIQGRYVGDSEKNLTKLFETASDGAIIVFDEADDLLAGETEHARSLIATFNKIVTSPSIQKKKLVIIATTNHPNRFKDPGVKRRLDTHVYIGLPLRRDREELLNYFIEKQLNCIAIGQKSALQGDDFAEIVKKTAGYSPDELRRLVDDAFSRTNVNKDMLTQLQFCEGPLMTKGAIPNPSYTPKLLKEGATPDDHCYKVDKVKVWAPWVCWPAARREEFEQALLQVSPTTTWSDLLSYYNFAKETNAFSTLLRICEDLRQYKSTILPSAELPPGCV